MNFEDLANAGEIKEERFNFRDIYCVYSLKNILEQTKIEDLKVSSKYLSKKMILYASMYRNTLLSDLFYKEYINRKITKLNAKLNKKHEMYESWSRYMAACETVGDEEENVVANAVLVVIIKNWLVVLKEKWQNWKYIED